MYKNYRFFLQGCSSHNSYYHIILVVVVHILNTYIIYYATKPQKSLFSVNKTYIIIGNKLDYIDTQLGSNQR